MTSTEFRHLVEEAVAGNREALVGVLELYTPLIDRFSKIDGRVDEDCRQYILLHITKNIRKFVI